MLNIKFAEGPVCIREITPDVARLIGKYGRLNTDGMTEFEAWRFRVNVKQRDTGKVYRKVAAYDTETRVAICLNDETGCNEEVNNVLHHISFRTEDDRLEIVDAEFDDDQWSVPFQQNVE